MISTLQNFSVDPLAISFYFVFVCFPSFFHFFSLRGIAAQLTKRKKKHTLQNESIKTTKKNEKKLENKDKTKY